MIHHRIWKERIKSLSNQFQCVSLLGARQVGKSTLAKLLFPDYEHVDLEDPLDFGRLNENLTFFLEHHNRVLIDEAQRLPKLFPALRSHIDKNKKFKVVLLGSASPSLVSAISESLTGRTAFFELSGISVLEHPINELWIRGGFPRLHWVRPKINPSDWFSSYLKTYLMQDIPQLGFRIASTRLMKLLQLIANSQGSICNLSELGGALGIKYNSVSHILDIFEGTFAIRRLQPYFANIGKRLVKSPKLYIRDTGLFHHLLGIPFTLNALERNQKIGASFESFCIEQILLHAHSLDSASEAYYFRTQAGAEVDLLLRFKNSLIPIEIKLSPPDRIRSLQICMTDLGLKKGYVVSAIKKGKSNWASNVKLCNLQELLSELKLHPKRLRAD